MSSGPRLAADGRHGRQRQDDLPDACGSRSPLLGRCGAGLGSQTVRPEDFPSLISDGAEGTARGPLQVAGRPHEEPCGGPAPSLQDHCSRGPPAVTCRVRSICASVVSFALLPVTLCGQWCVCVCLSVYLSQRCRNQESRWVTIPGHQLLFKEPGLCLSSDHSKEPGTH